MPAGKFTVVVADRAQAQLYETEKLGARLQRVATLDNPSGHGHERDLGSAAPGRSFNRSAGVHQTLSQRTSLREHSAEQFAKTIARSLSRTAAAAQCAGVVLVASPRFLSSIRKALSRNVQAKVVRVIAKDLAHQPQRIVNEHLRAA